jgi:hypothetical protein
VPVIGEVVPHTVIFVDTTAKSPEPQHSTAILKDGKDVVIAQTFDIGWIVPVMEETCSTSVQTIQPVDCTHP